MSCVEGRPPVAPKNGLVDHNLCVPLVHMCYFVHCLKSRRLPKATKCT